MISNLAIPHPGQRTQQSNHAMLVVAVASEQTGKPDLCYAAAVARHGGLDASAVERRAVYCAYLRSWSLHEAAPLPLPSKRSAPMPDAKLLSCGVISTRNLGDREGRHTTWQKAASSASPEMRYSAFVSRKMDVLLRNWTCGWVRGETGAREGPGGDTMRFRDSSSARPRRYRHRVALGRTITPQIGREVRRLDAGAVDPDSSHPLSSSPALCPPCQGHSELAFFLSSF